MLSGSTGAVEFLARHAEKRIRAALADTRIVAIVGPRQSGKTTLARRIAGDDDRPYLTLDDEGLRPFAREDPVGFLRGRPFAVIDEVQRAPSLILALKKSVDEDPRPGRYLITGSVHLFSSALSPDSLAGRVETIELLPFSEAEIGGTDPPCFVERSFAREFPNLSEVGATTDLAGRILRGGYPEAASRGTPARRRRWLRAYVDSLVERDAAEIGSIAKRGELRRMVDQAALSSGQLLNLSNLAARERVDAKTVDRWLDLLARMFLVRRIPAWARSDIKRMVRTPKLHFHDSGLLAALQPVTREDLDRDRTKIGPLLECMVHAELAKAAALRDGEIRISHYRDKDQAEVDFVLERPSGDLVGIEVKASATVVPRDFRGLARLRSAAGERFACGVVLHDGDRVQQTDSRMYAVPVKMLWES